MEYLESVGINQENTEYQLTIEGNTYSVPVEIIKDLESAGATIDEAQEIVAYLKNALTTNIQERRNTGNSLKLDAIEDCFDYELIANIVKRLIAKHSVAVVREMITMIKPAEIVSMILAGKIAQDEVIIAQFDSRVSSMIDYGMTVSETDYEINDPVETEATTNEQYFNEMFGGLVNYEKEQTEAEKLAEEQQEETSGRSI